MGSNHDKVSCQIKSLYRGKVEYIVKIGGKKSESRGIVDLVAIRKDHRRVTEGVKKGTYGKIRIKEKTGKRSCSNL